VALISNPNPPPMRDSFVGKSGHNTDNNSGISRPWYTWLKSVFDTLIAQTNAISGSTIVNSTQANLSVLAGTLTAANAGQLVYVTDYNHLLRWDGTAFQWGPGENGSGYVSAFINDPSPTTGWQLCDGSTTTRLHSDGSISAQTVPNYGTAAYLKLGSAPPVIGPTAPAGLTGATSAGTPTGTNSAPDTGNDVGGGTVVQVGIGATVAAEPHVHTIVAPTFTGNALATHTHAPGTVELERTQLKAWYRR
jgi:hypothetical protein